MVANGIQINTKGVLSIIKGKTFTQEFEIRDSAGALLDVSTGYTGKIMGRALITSSGTIFSGVSPTMIVFGNGKITVTMSGAATGALVLGEGVFAIELTKTAGTVVTDVIIGSFTVENGVVHAA